MHYDENNNDQPLFVYKLYIYIFFFLPEITVLKILNQGFLKAIMGKPLFSKRVSVTSFCFLMTADFPFKIAQNT